MIYFIAPSGGNNNYICMKLIGKTTGSATTYHVSGSHSAEKIIINLLNYKKGEMTPDTKVIISQDYNSIKDLIKPGDDVIQNYIDDDRGLLLLNWFHKNIEAIEDPEYPYLKHGWRDSWINWQRDLWKDVSKNPVASAVTEWMYKLFDDDFSDIKRVPEITKVFNWSVMYESSQATVDEFKKIGYNYTVEEHEKWLTSQSTILGYWQNIRDNIETPLDLEDDVHKGIALALNGKQYDLNRQQVESKFGLLP